MFASVIFIAFSDLRALRNALTTPNGVLVLKDLPVPYPLKSNLLTGTKA